MHVIKLQRMWGVYSNVCVNIIFIGDWYIKGNGPIICSHFTWSLIHCFNSNVLQKMFFFGDNDLDSMFSFLYLLVL